MFNTALAFNQPIGVWNVSNVTSMVQTFNNALAFNQDISGWDVSKVTNMSAMFWTAKAFNQPLNDWDVSNVVDFGYMFAGAVYNQPLDNWVTTSATDMSGMFNSAEFNQPIGNWDVSNVTRTSEMFAYTSKFNQPIGNWDVSNVTVNAMNSMFKENVVFDQDLSGWCVSKNYYEPDFWNTNGIISPEHQPFWGTCPVAGAVVTINVPPTANVEDTIPLSYTLTPEFTAGKVEWSTTTPDLVLIDTDENTLLIVDHGEIELTVTINNKITSTTTIVVAAPKVPFTASTTGTTLAMAAPENTVKLFVDGVEVVPTGTGWSYYYTNLGSEGMTVTVVPVTPSTPLGDFTFDNGISAVTNWGEGFKPNASIRFGTDLVSVPDHAPPGLKSLNSLFNGSPAFNDPNVVNWDMTGITNTGYMFLGAAAFNQDISNWKFDSVTNMDGMFYGTTAFNLDLTGWCVTNITVTPSDFGTDSALVPANYPVWGTCPVRDYTLTITPIEELMVGKTEQLNYASATVERMVRGFPKLVISVFKSLGENVLILFLSIMPNEIFETLYSRFEDCNSSLANSTKIPKISPLNSNVARSFDDHLNGKATMSKISFNNPLILFPSPDSWSTIKS
jgi:surface protein